MGTGADVVTGATGATTGLATGGVVALAAAGLPLATTTVAGAGPGLATGATGVEELEEASAAAAPVAATAATTGTAPIGFTVGIGLAVRVAPAFGSVGLTVMRAVSLGGAVFTTEVPDFLFVSGTGTGVAAAGFIGTLPAGRIGLTGLIGMAATAGVGLTGLTGAGGITGLIGAAALVAGTTGGGGVTLGAAGEESSSMT